RRPRRDGENSFRSRPAQGLGCRRGARRVCDRRQDQPLSRGGLARRAFPLVSDLGCAIWDATQRSAKASAIRRVYLLGRSCNAEARIRSPDRPRGRRRQQALVRSPRVKKRGVMGKRECIRGVPNASGAPKKVKLYQAHRFAVAPMEWTDQAEKQSIVST